MPADDLMATAGSHSVPLTDLQADIPVTEQGIGKFTITTRDGRELFWQRLWADPKPGDTIHVDLRQAREFWEAITAALAGEVPDAAGPP